MLQWGRGCMFQTRTANPDDLGTTVEEAHSPEVGHLNAHEVLRTDQKALKCIENLSRIEENCYLKGFVVVVDMSILSLVFSLRRHVEDHPTEGRPVHPAEGHGQLASHRHAPALEALGEQEHLRLRE